MRPPFLTVLTTPVLSGNRRMYQQMRRALRPIVKPGVPLPATSPYPGHYSVTRSVVEGLRQIRADFNFNPQTIGEVGRVVYAPANEALRQAAEWKRASRIQWLVAGPVNALSPCEEGSLLLVPEIDCLIVASDWVRDLYRQWAPSLLAKTRICPAGVDADFWSPSVPPQADRVVVYWKSGDEAFLSAVEQRVGRFGARSIRIRYGAYDRDAFRRALDGAGAAVFLSHFETQGLALAEAWSMDVPTAAWNPQGPAEWRGRPFQSGSSCPYLSRATGVAWRTLDELDGALGTILHLRSAFAARRWVLDHMSDAACARMLYDVIREGALATAGAR